MDLNGSKDGRDGSSVELFNNRVSDADVLHLARVFTAKGRLSLVRVMLAFLLLLCRALCLATFITCI